MLQIIAILFVITIIKYYICVTELNLLYDGSWKWKGFDRNQF